MSYLDNSGDIILDMVLTESGRFRLAKGDGSFRIVKFAVGDDEINYALYNKGHPSGTAYYDLNILQTPILEAFTDSAASLQSKLISIPRTNLIYLPILKLNEVPPENARHATGVFVVATDQNTEDTLLKVADNRGVLKGARPGGSSGGGAGGSGGATIIRVDQGLDTSELPPSFTIDADLIETQYIVEMDNRLCSMVDVNGNQSKLSFVDDDNIGSYYVSLGTDPTLVSINSSREVATGAETIAGPRGTIIRFKLRASIELSTSYFLFTLLGGTTTINTTVVNYIDSYIRVRGATTGYTLNLPIRFARI